jgi:Uma2 family endonuclease
VVSDRLIPDVNGGSYEHNGHSQEEFVERYAGDRTELIEGVVRELPMPMPKHGKMCFLIARVIGNFVIDRDIGHVMTNDSFIRTMQNPDSVRGADVCFYSYERLPKGTIPDGVLPNSPELVVEVKSPSDTWTEVFVKVGEYLASGVRAVIVIYRGNALQQTLQRTDELTIPEILPGFSVRVEQLFA